MSREESIRALRRSNPRRSAGFDESMGAYEPLRERVVSSDPEFAPRRRQRPLHLRLAMVGGVATVIAGIAVAWTLTAPVPPAGDNPGALPNAYAAVAKAVADTAAASKSGTIETRMRANWPERPRPEGTEDELPAKLPGSSLRLDTVFKWHEGDMSLRVGLEDQRETHESRYVDGKYYQQQDVSAPGEEPKPTTWVVYPESGDGKNAFEDPQAWVEAAASDVTGANLRRIIDATKGLKQVTNEDGSITYSGTATAGAIRGDNLGVSGLPMVSQPILKVRDMNTPCAVSVTVGPDGLIRGVRCSYETDGGKWEYESTYRDLGETPGIEAPDPATVKQWDPMHGKG